MQNFLDVKCVCYTNSVIAVAVFCRKANCGCIHSMNSCPSWLGKVRRTEHSAFIWMYVSTLFVL
jgi:hypothetical protein